MTAPGFQRSASRGPRTILVVGATGARGGSVARHLLARGFAVRALTRDPSSARAGELRSAGADLVTGDLGDRPSLRAALAGCWGAYGAAPPAESGESLGERACNLIHAVAGSEIEHFVLGLPPLPGQCDVETYARSLGLPATYLRPPFGSPDELAAAVTAILEWPGPFVGRTLTEPPERPPAANAGAPA